MKRVITSLLAAALALTLFFPAAAAETQIQSVTRQDQNMCVVIWNEAEGETYNVYRAEAPDGEYILIGSSPTGSFIDMDAPAPKTYYYKVETVTAAGSAFSLPAAEGTNPRKIHSVPIMMYHHFVDQADLDAGVVFDEYTLYASDFEADLKYLKSNGYTTITSDDLLAYMRGEKPLPAKPIILSIDDGSLGVYQHAYPLLRRYNMKADLNVIFENIDLAWEEYTASGHRDTEAPYCVWEELIEMEESGVINLCSHSYGLHRYGERKGMDRIDGESDEDYIAALAADMALVASSFTGWTGITPTTVAYPYSKRSADTDRLILEHTTYEILMAGQSSRGTRGNYFVDGAGIDGYCRLMSRPCRLHGTPISEYLKAGEEADRANGVQVSQSYIHISEEECGKIAAVYSDFADVAPESWYAGAVYYAYVNGILSGTDANVFSSQMNVSRAMTAVLLHRMAGLPESNEAEYSDVTPGSWYAAAAGWADENGILTSADGAFLPNGVISRQMLAFSMFQYAGLQKLDRSGRADLSAFADAGDIEAEYREAMEWAVDSGLLKGKGENDLDPNGSVTRAEMATILQRWNLSMQ